ncbi:MerR family transcriptional regulator [Candidatus Dependentiae bacterium]|nr:MerR family transcriptional regulator [Candidatus Dependentiae bacterium]MBU4387561.1 MerR family transcriptional regulator [Candidatus Dependentiae bacterium]MCG2756636.1 MerR family transcriptional regulator [Candidatus Dependentiae bacterium]
MDVKKFVIRFWEKEFDLKSDRSGGGQRFYTQEDLDRFTYIKELLYEKKFTIPGAKNQLNNLKEIKPAIKQEFTKTEAQNSSNIETKALFEKLNMIKKQLEILYQNL